MANRFRSISISSLGAGPPLPCEITVELQNRKLWQRFHAETTEMIITKLGRRMFPSIELRISGLERRARYCLLVEVAPASPRRHKYVVGEAGSGGGWLAGGPAEPQPRLERRLYLHPDGPASGAYWTRQPIAFDKLKLTNNAVEHRNNVVLTSMHRYVPRIWIVQCDEFGHVGDFASQPARCFVFEETEFVAVTAYQNENITRLKIDNNPFAKGFRETGQSRCKRKFRESLTEPSTSKDVSNEPDDRQVRPRLHRPWTCSPPPSTPPQPQPQFQLTPRALTPFPFDHVFAGFLSRHWFAHPASFLR